MRRRAFLEESGMAAAGVALSGALDNGARAAPHALDPNALVINPVLGFDLSPYLYMQFMEPLGATDGSVEAAWDHLAEQWREGVGPREARPAMVNLLWGGVESNQIGTGEFVEFFPRVGADPLLCVKFESDGRQQYTKYKRSVRTADATEAAAWVSYCNDPSNAERRGHGIA